jgi:predicted peptidase
MHCLPILLIFAVAFASGGCSTVTTPESASLQKLQPGLHQKTADIPGVGSLNYTIEIPSGYDGNAPVPLVLALHYGYAGAKPSPFTGQGLIDAFRPGLTELNAIIIAPDALGGTWTDARNEEAAMWLTMRTMNAYAIDRKKVVITGFSLGGEGVWFIGSRHQHVFTGAVPVAAPAAGGDVVWSIPVYVIHSNDDQVVSYNAAKKHADAVKARGTRLEFKTLNGLDHYNTSAYGVDVRDAVRWLQEEWK